MKQSAGLLVYRFRNDALEVFLVHSGGPFWKNKDTAAWSVPKGEFEEDESPLLAALREFREETGFAIPAGEPLALKPIRQSAHKTIQVWCLKGDFDPAAVCSNTFELEWPPHSGKMQSFPEVDKAGWFDLDTARVKLHKGQVPVLDQLVSAIGSR
jgi:predicted NUDIX family NTP pyrophosphohydrolase